MSRRTLATVLLLTGSGAGCASDACPKGSERRANDLCYLIDSAPDPGGHSTPDTATPSDTGRDTDDTSAPSGSYTYGDPITVLGVEASGGGEAMPIAYEWTDAAAISDELAIATGQGGYGLIDIPVDLVAGTSDGIIPPPNIKEHYRRMRAGGVQAKYKELDFGPLDFTFAPSEELMRFVLSRLEKGKGAAKREE